MTRVLLLSLAVVLSVALALELVTGPDPDEDGPAPPASLAAGTPAAAAAAGAPPLGKDGDGKDNTNDGLASLVRTMLARPLFNPNRRPAATADGSAAGASDTLPRLAGVIVGPGGRRAIFAPAEGRPLVVPEGGRIGRYVVRSIVPGQVTLSDAEQQLVIRPSHAKGTMP